VASRPLHPSPLPLFRHWFSKFCASFCCGAQEGSKQRLEELKKSVHDKFETIKSYPTEVRSSGIWQASSERILKQAGIGLVAGLAVGVVLFGALDCGLLPTSVGWWGKGD
jgi:hypothetical protein